MPTDPNHRGVAPQPTPVLERFFQPARGTAPRPSESNQVLIDADELDHLGSIAELVQQWLNAALAAEVTHGGYGELARHLRALGFEVRNDIE